MKKWGWKQISVIGLALSLTFSSTAFAGEISAVESTDKVQQTETQMETDHGLETRLYTVEKELSEKITITDNNIQQNDEIFVLKNITLEELESIKEEPDTSLEDENEMPQTVLIVFQTENFWNQDNIPDTEALPVETQPVEAVLDTVQESEILEETEGIAALPEESLPVITLTKEQEEQVIKTASLVSETIVVVNGGTLEDESLFKSQKNVKAVLSMNEKTEEAFEEVVKNLDLEEVYADYQKKIKEVSAKTTAKVAMEAETDSEQSEVLLPGNLLSKTSIIPNIENNSTSGTTGTTEGGSLITPGTTTNGTSGTAETSDTSETSGTPGTATTTTTTKKDITITMVPELLEEEDDCLYAIYEISCPSDVMISEATFKLTYDSTKMDYDKDYSDAGEDVFDDFDYTGTDNTGSVTIMLKSSNGTAQAMTGSVLDLGFELKSEAKVGDVYNLNLEVTSLKNGTTELTTDPNYNITVKEESIIAVAYEEEDIDDETESQTQTQTQTQTQAQTTELQTAAKTADSTNSALWLSLMIASVGVYVFSARRKKQVD